MSKRKKRRSGRKPRTACAPSLAIHRELRPIVADWVAEGELVAYFMPKPPNHFGGMEFNLGDTGWRCRVLRTGPATYQVGMTNEERFLLRDGMSPEEIRACLEAIARSPVTDAPGDGGR